MEETFPIPEGTVSPTHVHPPPPKMDSCAPCCFTVFVRLGFLRGGRSVSGDNPFPSPCISWVRNTGCTDLPRHPFGEFGLNFSWLLCQRERVVPPDSHSLSLSGAVTGKWLLGQGRYFCIWMPPCDRAHDWSLHKSDATSWAAQKTLWGSSMLLFPSRLEYR